MTQDSSDTAADATDAGTPTADVTDTLVATRAGVVRGGRTGTTLSWKGIRYAEAPVGPLRWRAPRPAAPWDGVADATAYGPVSPQLRNPAVPLGPDAVMDEDCLRLNVWRSAAAAAEPLPVMVWLHGGAYTFGASSQPLFDGSAFVSTGEVVLITVNYRVGALGFLDLTSYATEEERFDSNLALRDVLLALEWVRQNVGAFGGDPESVTVFGESAGGGLVTSLLATPSASGLFHRAIAESSPVSSMYGTERSRAVAARMLRQLDVADGDIQRMRELSADAIVDAAAVVYAAVPSEEPGTLAFAPVVDGDLLPEHPITVLRDGRGHPVPLIIGTNKDEAALFKFMKSPLIPITDDKLTAMVARIAEENPDVEIPSREQVLDAYEGLRAHAVGLAVARDIGFRMPTVWAAEGHAAIAPVWLYRFDYATPMLTLLGIGATHATELPYVWGNLDGGPKDITFRLGGRATGRALSARVQARWLAFACGGAPDIVADGGGWPAYDPAAARATLVIGRHDAIVDDLDAGIRAGWGDEVLSFT